MMAARSMPVIKGNLKPEKMKDLLQTTGIQVLDANEDTTLSGATEGFYGKNVVKNSGTSVKK